MIDGHCHLDPQSGDLKKAFQILHGAAVESGISGIILLNIQEQGFQNEKVIAEAKKYEGYFSVFPGINPLKENIRGLPEKYRKAGAKGIKLHPRMHGYSVDFPECLELLKEAGDSGLPVLIDCFPDGKNLALKNVPESFAVLSEQAKSTRIAIGHSGGHRILDAMMVAKYYPNIYLDLSFTLLYYRDLQIHKEIAYVLKCMKYEKIFWGTDYPDRPYKKSVEQTLDEFGKMDLSGELLKKVLSENIRVFLGE